MVANYVDIAFDALSEQPTLPLQVLHMPPFDGYHWSTQVSGVRIPANLAVELEEVWSAAVGARGIGFPDEMGSADEFPEGGSRQVYVNKYERNSAARETCLRHFGRSCSVCGMTFDERYGAIASAFIQVHHLKPLSEIRTNYSVDPVEDLRPICPNCHAVVHLRRPPLTIGEAKELLGARVPDS
ncbi:MAG: hypothetical protein HGB10_08755 [Coriobacteriia bacterium]|nr:hypothetical protein [Coriobacteriia bacterium]